MSARRYHTPCSLTPACRHASTSKLVPTPFDMTDSTDRTTIPAAAQVQVGTFGNTQPHMTHQTDTATVTCLTDLTRLTAAFQPLQ
jgi:hypothetical protein